MENGILWAQGDAMTAEITVRLIGDTFHPAFILGKASQADRNADSAGITFSLINRYPVCHSFLHQILSLAIPLCKAS